MKQKVCRLKTNYFTTVLHTVYGCCSGVVLKTAILASLARHAVVVFSANHWLTVERINRTISASVKCQDQPSSFNTPNSTVTACCHHFFSATWYELGLWSDYTSWKYDCKLPFKLSCSKQALIMLNSFYSAIKGSLFTITCTVLHTGKFAVWLTVRIYCNKELESTGYSALPSPQRPMQRACSRGSADRHTDTQTPSTTIPSPLAERRGESNEDVTTKRLLRTSH